MQQLIFYQLLKNRKDNAHEYIPVWKFMGEFKVEETGQWGWVSYEVAARMSEVWKEVPFGIIERIDVTGKSGAQYKAYRLCPTMRRCDLLNRDLLPKYREIVELIK